MSERPSAEGTSRFVCRCGKCAVWPGMEPCPIPPAWVSGRCVNCGAEEPRPWAETCRAERDAPAWCAQSEWPVVPCLRACKESAPHHHHNQSGTRWTNPGSECPIPPATPYLCEPCRNGQHWRCAEPGTCQCTEPVDAPIPPDKP